MKTTVGIVVLIVIIGKLFFSIKTKPGKIRKLRLRAKNIQYQLTNTNIRNYQKAAFEKDYKDALAEHLTEKVMFILGIAEVLLYALASLYLIF